MSEVPIKKVQYVTPSKMKKVNPDNIKKYEKYMRSNIIKNQDVKDTTYKTYKSYFNQFLVFLMEKWDNVGLYDEELFDNAIDIMEEYMAFCGTSIEEGGLANHKKVINTKISAVSSFYLWSLKRRLIDKHPFDKMLDRMKGAKEEHIINAYFLTDEQIDLINEGLIDEDNNFDLLDIVLWHVMLDSANRIGAIEKLTLSQMNIDECTFKEVREKEGYRVDVSFSENTKEIILKWLEYRKDKMDNLEVDALFVSKYNGVYKQMERTTLQKRIRKIGTIIGLDDFHCHCVRKTASNRLLNSGIDVNLVASYLNHKNPSTTLEFYQKPKSSSEIRNEIMSQMKALSSKVKKENTSSEEE